LLTLDLYASILESITVTQAALHGRFSDKTTVHRCTEEGLVGGANFAVDALRPMPNRGKGEANNPVLPKAVMPPRCSRINHHIG